jgi:hypothetical protein
MDTSVKFSSKNLVVSVSKMREYGVKRAQNSDTSKGFENLSQVSDAKIAEIIGDANTIRKANYRISGFVGQSTSFLMQKDWQKITGNKDHKIAKNDAKGQVLGRYQISKITS